MLDSVAAPELRLLNVVAPVTSSVPATTVLPVSPATVNLFDEIASDPSDAVTANFPLFTSTSPATSSVLDSVAAPELRLLNVVAPVTSSVPATTVLPVSPATVNLFDEIASDPSDAVTANFPLFTSTSPATSSVLDSVAQLRLLNVAPVTSSVLDSVLELRLLNVVAPVTSSVPATTVLPVSPATVNLFDEIASDPSDAVTANFPLFTSTSPATSSVLDSVAAPELRLLNVVAPVTSSVLDSVAAPELRLLNVVAPVTSSVPATTVLPVSPATVNLFDEIASDPSDAVTANFPLFTSTSPATSSVLDSVAAPELRLLNVVAPVTSSVLDSVVASSGCSM